MSRSKDAEQEIAKTSGQDRNLPEPVGNTSGAVSPLADYIRYSEFKRLLGQLHTTFEKKKVKSISLLSDHTGEGKTFLTGAIAMGYAILLNKKVLILNAGGPVQKGSLSLKHLYESELKGAYYPHVPVEKREKLIDFVSPSNPDGTAFEAADFQLGSYLEAISGQYDLVLVDTCALKVANKNNMDPVVVARQTDASVLVTSQNSMNRPSLKEIQDKLRQWEVKPLGLIYNSGVAS